VSPSREYHRQSVEKNCGDIERIRGGDCAEAFFTLTKFSGEARGNVGLAAARSTRVGAGKWRGKGKEDRIDVIWISS